MIELMEKYRAAKAASEQAAKDLGVAFGAAFEIENSGVPEMNSVPDEIPLGNPPRIADLINTKVGLLVEQSLHGFIDRREGVVGVSLNNSTLSRTEGNRVPLEEAHFAQGFADGFRQSRTQRRR